MSEERYIRQARFGDPLAGPILVSMYERRLASYIRTIAPWMSDPDIEICAEMAIESAVNNMDKFTDEKGTFFGWLRGFARNKVHEMRRQTQQLNRDIQIEPRQDDQFAPQDLPSEPGPDDTPTPPGWEEVRTAIDQLGPSDQLIIALRELNQLPYDRIAELLGASEQACRQRHKRALQRLRDLIDNNPTDDEE